MNVKDWLSDEEIREFTTRSDAKAWQIVFWQYLVTALAFALPAIWTNPLTILAAVILLGSRHMGFGVIVHECGHRSMFASQHLNEWVGNWLGAAPNFNNMQAYAKGHLNHHRLAGSDEDPDLPNYRDYPITRERLRRKLGRDFTGQTGWRALKGIARTVGRLPELGDNARTVVVRAIAFNVALLGLLTAVGHAWLYLLWVASYVFVYQAITRIRQVSEHAAVPDLYDPDPRRNTRTIRANWFWRGLFSPHNINYHLEHHLMPSVPIYNLQPMHERLVAKGAYEGVHFPDTHLQMLQEVTRSGRGLAPA